MQQLVRDDRFLKWRAALARLVEEDGSAGYQWAGRAAADDLASDPAWLDATGAVVAQEAVLEDVANLAAAATLA